MRSLVWAVLVAGPALHAAEPPDYFANLRDPAFVEVDQQYLVKDKSAPPDSAPLFRVRHLILRLKSYAEEARRWWPRRNILLVQMPTGRQWVIEDTFSKVDFDHYEELVASKRVSSGSGVIETWEIRDALEMRRHEKGDFSESDESPCGGTRYRVSGGGLEVSGIAITDWRSRTVAAAIAEIRKATFSAEDVEDLSRLLSMEPPRGGSDVNSGAGLRLVWSLLFVDRPVVRPEQRNLVLVPDGNPPGDLASWRALTYLPQDLPAFPPLPRQPGVN